MSTPDEGRGGRQHYIANGSYGCVMHPHVPCSDGSRTSAGVPLVSKIFGSSHHAKEEYDIHNTMAAKADRHGRFTVRLAQMCPMATDSVPPEELGKCGQDLTNSFQGQSMLTQLVYEDGGIALNECASKGVPLADVVRGLRTVLMGIGRLAAQQLVHLDIKPRNMVYNKDGRVLLIDFGLMTAFGDVYGNRNHSILKTQYEYYPPEFELYSQWIGGAAPQSADLNFGLHMQTFQRLSQRAFEEHTTPATRRNIGRYLNNEECAAQAYTLSNTLTVSGGLNTDYLNQNLGQIYVYSFGISMAELVVSYMRKEALRPDEADLATAIMALARKMMHFVPHKRPTAVTSLKLYDATIKPLLPKRRSTVQATAASRDRHARRAPHNTAKPKPKLGSKSCDIVDCTIVILHSKGIRRVVSIVSGRQITVGGAVFRSVCEQFGTDWLVQYLVAAGVAKNGVKLTMDDAITYLLIFSLVVLLCYTLFYLYNIYYGPSACPVSKTAGEAFAQQGPKRAVMAGSSRCGWTVKQIPEWEALVASKASAGRVEPAPAICFMDQDDACASLASAHGVASYPTLLVLNQDGSLVLKSPGYKDRVALVQLLSGM
ncbi:hypothetical protein VOLCADRAFT_108154 [Volvox carteri f. nagariensis]|uniref:Protein kinase domain-containing protein n=1 Tax=Volvox carteri f. nagariensis TaxID=3068 RepID=D8UIL0_VOLCA|nr:uncharacterized protein VOLCADRAFT_108154 [Volvox carteri f. nagariensis]EFJ40431.1 hypothetical protein VOLCADRAFT_108154 [Volvox carteri f. nagariensis]|eukprot:XP_002958511.1 hypothetical protein VOLCADRAFT_108154 [Volvox carteri f. nagariensis]